MCTTGGRELTTKVVMPSPTVFLELFHRLWAAHIGLPPPRCPAYPQTTAVIIILIKENNMTLIKINREALLRPLQAVSGIIERRHTLPILSNVLLERTGNRISLVATDIEIEITAVTSLDSDGENKAITVGARKLLDILRALPETSEVSLALQERRLQLKSGKSRFNLQTLPPEDFPRLAAAEGSASKFSMPQKLLRTLLALVQYAMAQQDIRYYLNGLLMVLDGGTLKLVATDGHRLAFASRDLGAKDLPKQEVILPRKTIIELTKLLSDTEDPVSIELSSNQARFSFGEVLLISKLVDGKFPDYGRVIPQDQPKHLRLKRTELLAALQRAAILTSDKFRGVRWVLSNGGLKIICTNTEQEEAQEELDVDYKGDGLDIGFNVGYLLDVLNNLDVDEIDCGLGDANSSALFTVPSKADFKYVVMPMRI
jgi:DNA polymerase-3 subunit beta